MNIPSLQSLLSKLVVSLLFFIGLYYFIGHTSEGIYRFQYQLWLSRAMIISAAIYGLALLYFNRGIVRSAIGAFFLKPGPALNLAIFRIVFFGLVQPLLLWHLTAGGFPWAEMPLSARAPLPHIEWFVNSVPINPAVSRPLIIISFVTTVLAAIGLFTRAAIMVHFVAVFYVIGVPNFFGKVNHHHFHIWFPAILAFAPCAETLSVDNWIKRLRGLHTSTPPHAKYTIPLRIIWLLIGVIYFFPGFWKLWDCGLDWALTDNLRNQMHFKWIELNGWVPYFRIDRFPLLYSAAAITVMLWEISFIFMLLNSTTRKMAVAGGLLFHIMTFMFMKIGFFTLIPCYAAFVNWHRLFNGEGILEGTSNIQFEKFFGITRNRGITYMAAIGIVFIGMNGIYGFMKTTSWPFACFPTFAHFPRTETQILRYVIINGSERKLLNKNKLKSLIETSRYRAMEHRIADLYNNKNITELDTSLKNIAGLLQFIKVSDVADSIEIYIDEVPIHPDSESVALKSRLIYKAPLY